MRTLYYVIQKSRHKENQQITLDNGLPISVDRRLLTLGRVLNVRL